MRFIQMLSLTTLMPIIKTCCRCTDGLEEYRINKISEQVYSRIAIKMAVWLKANF